MNERKNLNNSGTALTNIINPKLNDIDTASQNVNIEIGELPYNEFKVSLVNVLGEKVFSKYFRIVSEKSVGLSLEGMPKGYYNVLFESGDKLISEPLIVQ